MNKRHLQITPSSLFVILFLSIWFPVKSQAQLTIVKGSDITLTPLEFVQTYLVGSGVTVSNALYNGSPNPLNIVRAPSNTTDQIGTFTALGEAFETMGLQGGILLSSGKVQNASHEIYPSGEASYNSGSGGDGDLTLLAGFPSKDKSILEFDIVPLTDVITFRYVFASEEFDDYCHNDFNDAFGFFISGPGIPAGPYSGGAQNIALLPVAALPVTIENICFTDSGLVKGTYSWLNGNGPIYNYDRFAYVFTASISVICAQTYHLKLAIGDAVDGQLDSGIFLEENSLTSNNFTGSTSFSNPLTGPLLVEGCSDVSLVYEIPEPRFTDLTINLAIDGTGTATQADILPNPFPHFVVIPAGALQSMPVSIVPVIDGLPETAENLVIVASTTVCDNSNMVTKELFLKDYSQLSVNVEDVTVCDGSPATLFADAAGGQPVLPDNLLLYEWSTGDTTASVIVSPPVGLHLYSVTVTDACGQTSIHQASVQVALLPGPASAIVGSASVCKPSAGLAYYVPAITGADSYLWSVPSGATIVSGNGTNTITVDFSAGAVSGDITVMGHSALCGNGAPYTLPVTFIPLPENAGAIASAGGAEVCQNESGVIYTITPLANTSDYLWSYSGSGVTFTNNGPELIIGFSPLATSGFLTVKGHSQCGEGIQSPMFPVTVDAMPEAQYSICNTIKTTKNGRPVILKGGKPLGNTGVYSGPGVTMVSPGIYVFDPASNSVIVGTAGGTACQITYQYTNIDGCSDQKTASITVFPSNENDPCPGILPDHRDGKSYPTFLVGTGLNARCWMAANLDYGSYTTQSTAQSDNCVAEKYCADDLPAQCDIFGGNYQWGEIMEYNESSTFQDICPGGWHLATTTEWDGLISAFMGNGIAGGSLKNLPSTSGFDGIPGGISYHNTLWAFTSGAISGSFYWTSESLPNGHAVARGLNSPNPSVSWYPSSRANALSVRCVRN